MENSGKQEWISLDSSPKHQDWVSFVSDTFSHFTEVLSSSLSSSKSDIDTDQDIDESQKNKNVNVGLDKSVKSKDNGEEKVDYGNKREKKDYSKYWDMFANLIFDLHKSEKKQTNQIFSPKDINWGKLYNPLWALWPITPQQLWEYSNL